MHILITGGTGLIGRQLCKVLLAEGHELTVLSRNPDSVPAKCGANVHAMAGLDEWQPDQDFRSDHQSGRRTDSRCALDSTAQTGSMG